MRITSITIHNFRNLDDISIQLHEKISYIVGENNLGKSNFLLLLNKISNGSSFGEEEFTNPGKPIEIQMTLKLDSNEIGFFGDNFCPDNSSLIHLMLRQSIEDSFPEVLCTDTEEKLPLKYVKKILCVEYNSAMNPQKELKFNGNGSASIVINDLTQNYFDQNPDETYLNDQVVEGLKDYITNQLSKIKGLEKQLIEVEIASNPKVLLPRLIQLTSSGRSIEEAGCGVQYLAMAKLCIIAQIIRLQAAKAIKFSERTYEDSDGKTVLPIIITVDEPEVHLNPFKQRSLIRSYKQILENRDIDFNELLQSLFKIDRLDGQLIVITHSTDGLIDDHTNIIRFYKDEGKTKTVSGYNIDPNRREEKILKAKFPEFKDAFFARVVIIVEGKSEYGCMKQFAETLGYSFDDLSICVIRADGESGIKPISDLLNLFKIPSICFYDKDVEHNGLTESKNIFTTSTPCYETEVIETLINKGRKTTLEKLIKEFETDINIDNQELDILSMRKLKSKYIDKWKKYLKNHHNEDPDYDPKQLENKSFREILDGSEKDIYNGLSAWLMFNKEIAQGRRVGNVLSADEIPESYRMAIERAVEVAVNAE